MRTPCGIYEIRQEGRVTVVGFDPVDVPNHFYHDECRSDLQALIEHAHCEVLVFDLSCMQRVIDGLFGLFDWLIAKGLQIVLVDAPVTVKCAAELLSPRPAVQFVESH